MNSLICFFVLLVFSFANSQNGLNDYWLQVSHQAPTILSNVTFLINGQTLKPFENIMYGSGSSWVNVSSIVSRTKEQVNITVQTIQGLMITSQNLTLKQKFFTFFLITEKDGSDVGTLHESWDYQIPSNTSWFLMINLSPFETGKVTFRINEDALKESVDYQESSDWYAAVSGLYEFVVTNSSDKIVGTSIFDLRPGVIHTIVLNGIFNTSVNQLFILENWQSESPFSQLRSVQSIPEEEAYVWIDGKQYWKSLDYKNITKYEAIPAQKNLEIFVSLTAEMPHTPSLKIDTQPFVSYSLLITQNLEKGIPLQVLVMEDQSSVPFYKLSSERVVYLSPTDDDSLVYLNDQFVGKISYLEATNYSQEEDLPLNLTITNKDFRFEEEIDSVSLGSAYSIFMVGAGDYEVEALTSPDVLWQKIEEVEDLNDYDDDDDDDDDGGLSGGEIAGIIIGVSVVVGLCIGGVVLTKRRRGYYQSINR